MCIKYNYIGTIEQYTAIRRRWKPEKEGSRSLGWFLMVRRSTRATEVGYEAKKPEVSCWAIEDPRNLLT